MENVQVAATLTARASRNFVSLFDCATHFVENCLDIRRTDPGFSIVSLKEAAVRYKAPKTDLQQLKDTLEPLFAHGVSVDTRTGVYSSIEQYAQHRAKDSLSNNLLKRKEQEMNTSSQSHSASTRGDVGQRNPKSKKQRKAGDIDLPERLEVAKQASSSLT